MKTEKRRNFIINLMYWVLILAIGFAAFRYVVPLLMPFIFAMFVAWVLQPVVRFFNTKLHIPKKLGAILTVVLFLCTAGALVFFAGAEIVGLIKSLFASLPSFYSEKIEPALYALYYALRDAVAAIKPEAVEQLADAVNSVISSLGDSVSSLSMQALGALSGAAASLPRLVLSVLMSIISTFFITTDYDNIAAFIARQLNEKTLRVVMEIKTYTTQILFKYIRSYLLIMLITFCELTLGYWVVGVENFLLAAALTAIFDILPVAGSGGIMIPWAIIALASGRFPFAIGMIILYVIITVIRQIIEPKIIGRHVGLHPVVTLMAMFVGTMLFGVLGLFGLPITIAILKSLNDSGTIKIFK